MGTKMRQSIACLIMGLFEGRVFSSFHGNTPILYNFYIKDDIVAASVSWKVQQLESIVALVKDFYPCLKFTHTISTSSVTFQDMGNFDRRPHHLAEHSF